MNTLLNANLHFEAEFVRQQFPGLRWSKTRKLMFAAIIDEALDEGDILTAQEICERHAIAVSKACLDDVEREVAALEAEIYMLVDDDDIMEEDAIALSPDLAEIVEVDLSDIEDALEVVDNGGKIIPFRAVA